MTSTCFNDNGKKSQIALEFIIVYSFVLIVFIIVFGIAATQRAAGLANNQYSNVQLVGQNIVSYLDQAAAAGSGFNGTMALPQYTGVQPYSISITSTGIVTINTTVGTQKIIATAYSNAKDVVGPSVIPGSVPTAYSIPAYTGEVKVTNFDGKIYVDSTAPQALLSPNQASLMVPSSTEVANFSGALANNVIEIPNPKQNLAGSMTIAFWIDPRNIDAGRLNPIAKEYWGEFALTVEIGGGMSYYQGPNTSSSTYCALTNFLPSNSLLNDTWKFVAITRSGNGIVTNSILSYLNGSLETQGSCAGYPSAVSNTPISIGKQYTGYEYGGYMADVQIYNTTLSNTLISELYRNGINASPVNTNSLVAWLPLNGNTNDYSPNNNNGVPYNMSYAYSAEVDLHSALQNGAPGLDTPGGIIIPGSSFTSYANASGNITGYLNTNRLTGNNFTGMIYNGNPALAGNIVGFWPLELGYGSTAYDLSTHRNNGAINGAAWGPMPLNATNLQTASFGGSQSVFIRNAPLNNAMPFTISAWVELNNNPSFFRNIVASNCFRLEASSYTQVVFGASASCGTAVSITATTSNMLGNESLISVTYSGGHVKIYFNGNLANSTLINLEAYPITAMSIGKDNLSGIGSLDYMYGNVSNVQIYDTALSGKSIMQIYNEGMNGTPLYTQSLAGWYPLDGNANDYVNSSGSGIPFGVTYPNRKYIGKNQNVFTLNFKGENSGSYVNLGGALTNLSGDLSVATWVYPLNYSNYDYAFSNARDCCGSYNGFEIGLDGHQGLFKIWNTSLGSGNYEYATGGNASYDAWTLLVGTYNGTHIDLYMNGKLVSSNAATVPAGTPASFNSYIGALGVGPTTYEFNGTVADVQVYDIALNSSTVKQLYYQGLPPIARASTSYG